jgi:hypothetical protein
VWLPLKLEKLTLATRLTPDECRVRLDRTTSNLIDFFRPGLRPVRGFVLKRGFYLGRGASTRAWLRTWISGQMRRVEQKTVIEVSIGPNRIAGFFLTVLATMLGIGAAIATFLAFTSPFESWRSVLLSWTVVGTFIAVFFVLPASDHAGERAFLLDYLRRTLEASDPTRDSRH